MKLPKAKTENIVLHNLEKEVLLYNLQTDKAFCLNETSAIVYQACDGRTSFDQLKTKYKFSDDLIFMALDDLKKENLLEDKSYKSAFDGMSRREVIRKVGLASLIALPVITSLVTPVAAQTGSCLALNQRNCNVTPCCPGLFCFAGIASGTCVNPPPGP